MINSVSVKLTTIVRPTAQEVGTVVFALSKGLLSLKNTVFPIFLTLKCKKIAKFNTFYSLFRLVTFTYLDFLATFHQGDIYKIDDGQRVTRYHTTVFL